MLSKFLEGTLKAGTAGLRDQDWKATESLFRQPDGTGRFAFKTGGIYGPSNLTTAGGAASFHVCHALLQTVELVDQPAAALLCCLEPPHLGRSELHAGNREGRTWAHCRLSGLLLSCRPNQGEEVSAAGAASSMKLQPLAPEPCTPPPSPPAVPTCSSGAMKDRISASHIASE